MIGIIIEENVYNYGWPLGEKKEKTERMSLNINAAMPLFIITFSFMTTLAQHGSYLSHLKECVAVTESLLKWFPRDSNSPGNDTGACNQILHRSYFVGPPGVYLMTR